MARDLMHEFQHRRHFVIAVSAVLALVGVSSLVLSVSESQRLRRSLDSVRAELARLRKDTQAVSIGLSNEVDQRTSELSGLRKDTQAILSKLSTEADQPPEETNPEEQPHLDALGEAKALIQKLGDNPSAERLAETILTLDGWVVKPADEDAFRKFKLDQQSRLRDLVKAEVKAHQGAALVAQTNADGAKEHAEAGQILAMYPMSDERAVVEEAKSLATQQAELAGRLDVLRRQRYNRWAAEQIEKSIDYYNANVSKWNPLNDNSVLINTLVDILGQVDPVFLEPAVLELYNYVLDRTKGSISEKNKVEFAKRLTDPAIRRKALGDP